ncbi:translation initiation factor IF-2 [Streptomyces sp. bgisy100]|uniref:translation initiation factor IF-2 n=1 Tax=Streptomyces sp. bgisy100 TaxID=3413783 RepID=UPI003D72E089
MPSGVTHVRARHTRDFTVIANRLAQRAGSAVTVGVAVYVLSLPDGAPISIKALCAHFSEGEILIGRALRELEADGWIERRVERTAGGRIRTRTFFYDDPARRHREPMPEPYALHKPNGPHRPYGPPAPPAPTPVPSPAPAPAPATARVSGPDRAPVLAPLPDPAPAPVPEDPPHPVPRAAPASTAPTSTTPASPAAVSLTPSSEADAATAVLGALRVRDARLLLSEREIRQLVPAVVGWMRLGAQAAEIVEALTIGLPARIDRRPARLLAYRLRTCAPSRLGDATTDTTAGTTTGATTGTGAGSAPGAVMAVPPLQNCDGCDRAFRSPRPGKCRDCRDSPDFQHPEGGTNERTQPGDSGRESPGGTGCEQTRNATVMYAQ